MVEVGNSTSTSLVANQTIPFTTQTFDTNPRIFFDRTNNAIVITKVGKYQINGTFTFAPTDDGISQITAYANGVAIPFDTSSFTAVATNTYTFTLPQKLINVVPTTSGNVVKITFQPSVDGTLTNALASVSYVE